MFTVEKGLNLVTLQKETGAKGRDARQFIAHLEAINFSRHLQRWRLLRQKFCCTLVPKREKKVGENIFESPSLILESPNY